MRSFLSYWRRVIIFAWRRTLAFYGHPLQLRTCLSIVAFVVAALALRQAGEGEVVSGEVMWAFALLGAVALTFVSVFMFNLTYAPGAIDQEQRACIEELTPPPGALLTTEVGDDWAYLAVQNAGDPDVFIAQVIDARSDSRMVLPWAMKWRQGGEEQRLTKGERRLVEIGHTQIFFTYPENAPQEQGFGYMLQSTTATFGGGGRLVGTIRKDHSAGSEELCDLADEEALRHMLALLVEVRGVTLGSVQASWVNLGFTYDGDPLAELGESPLITPDAGE